jgi:hypothetical protein
MAEIHLGSLDAVQRIVLSRAEQERLWLDRPGGYIYDEGRPLPSHLAEGVHYLLGGGHLQVSKREYPPGSSLRVCLTQSGMHLLRDLEDHQYARIMLDRSARRPQRVSTYRFPFMEDLMWLQWTAVAVVLAFVIGRSIINLFDRPTRATHPADPNSSGPGQ